MELKVHLRESTVHLRMKYSFKTRLRAARRRLLYSDRAPHEGDVIANSLNGAAPPRNSIMCTACLPAWLTLSLAVVVDGAPTIRLSRYMPITVSTIT